MTHRDLEKLKAIGYQFTDVGDNHPADWIAPGDADSDYANSLEEAVVGAKAHSQTPGALKATMADKVRWLGGVDIRRAIGPTANRPVLWDALSVERIDGDDRTLRAETRGHDSPEAAVDSLFWAVP